MIATIYMCLYYEYIIFQWKSEAAHTHITHYRVLSLTQHESCQISHAVNAMFMFDVPQSVSNRITYMYSYIHGKYGKLEICA